MKGLSLVLLALLGIVWFLMLSTAYCGVDASPAMNAVISRYEQKLYTTTDLLPMETSFLNKVWPPSFNSPWPSSSGGDYATGKYLPPEVASAAFPLGYVNYDKFVADLTTGFRTGPHPVLANQAETDSCAAIYEILWGAIDSDQADIVPKLLESRQDALPPTKGDFVIFNLVVACARTHASIDPMPDAAFGSWTKLARARNPVYRLIAAEAFSRIAQNSDQWGRFYSLFAKETDPRIVGIIVDILASCVIDVRREDRKVFITTLQAIRTGQASVGNAAVVQHTDLVIHNIIQNVTW